jgi:hypothetical protein
VEVRPLGLLLHLVATEMLFHRAAQGTMRVRQNVVKPRADNIIPVKRDIHGETRDNFAPGSLSVSAHLFSSRAYTGSQHLLGYDGVKYIYERLVKKGNGARKGTESQAI